MYNLRNFPIINISLVDITKLGVFCFTFVICIKFGRFFLTCHPFESTFYEDYLCQLEKMKVQNKYKFYLGSELQSLLVRNPEENLTNCSTKMKFKDDFQSSSYVTDYYCKFYLNYKLKKYFYFGYLKPQHFSCVTNYQSILEQRQQLFEKNIIQWLDYPIIKRIKIFAK